MKLIISILMLLGSVAAADVPQLGPFVAATNQYATDNMWPDTWQSTCYVRPDGEGGTELDCVASASGSLWGCSWGHLDAGGYMPSPSAPDNCAPSAADAYYTAALHPPWRNCSGACPGQSDPLISRTASLSRLYLGGDDWTGWCLHTVAPWSASGYAPHCVAHSQHNEAIGNVAWVAMDYGEYASGYVVGCETNTCVNAYPIIYTWPDALTAHAWLSYAYTLFSTVPYGGFIFNRGNWYIWGPELEDTGALGIQCGTTGHSRSNDGGWVTNHECWISFSDFTSLQCQWTWTEHDEFIDGHPVTIGQASNYSCHGSTSLPR